jgi:hypothetical protein
MRSATVSPPAVPRFTAEALPEYTDPPLFSASGRFSRTAREQALRGLFAEMLGLDELTGD